LGKTFRSTRLCLFPSNHRYNGDMKFLRLAFSFLTIIPMPAEENVELQDLGRAAGWYPLVGALIGAAVALVMWGAGMIFPSLVAAVLAAAVWTLLTGGLHLDGLADCCDGMLAAAAPARRLEIMKDSRLGTFGGIGLIVQFALKVTLLSVLPGPVLILAVPLAAALGRWLVLLAARQPQARPGGLGAAFATGLGWRIFVGAALLPLALTVAAGWRGVIAALAAHLVAYLIFALARRRLGGVTGDVMGMVIELAEGAVLLVFAASWPPVV
jgi:adenosylcobinamide-GDP ribazoletransferase